MASKPIFYVQTVPGTEPLLHDLKVEWELPPIKGAKSRFLDGSVIHRSTDVDETERLCIALNEAVESVLK